MDEITVGGERYRKPMLVEGRMGTGEVDIASSLAEERMRGFASKVFGVSNVYLLDFGLAVYEAAFNAMKHGGGGLLAAREVESGGGKGVAVVCVDHGPGFNVMGEYGESSKPIARRERRGMPRVVDLPSEVAIESLGRRCVKERGGTLHETGGKGFDKGALVKMTFWEKDVKKY